MTKLLLPSALLALVLASPVNAETQSGNTQVVSTDRITVDGKTVQIWGIDALEPEQICHRQGKPWSCGLKAITFLRDMVKNRTIKCVPRGAGLPKLKQKCAVGSLDIGAALIGHGYALPDTEDSKKYYGQLFREARGQGAGMFSGTFVTPWDWRDGKR
jgi:endonuclease YncB( thermonuclease family)